ncbi:Type II/IV secretion system ATP hydrolase TadA/VirB11/CpaF, TadA subfamily [Olavius algarvensis Delta 1 endosymbiont]|nr:Type II/IV secretion system ATP hydrolase TadA/VirB11/CpaF, TadA subfamily [Olavius algarvensis Delta 1 endosymbiont]
MQLERHAENVMPRSAGKYIPDEYFEFKTRIHDRLLDLMDLSLIERLTREDLKAQIRKLVGQILIDDPGVMPLNHDERERLFSEIQDEVLGLGPLEPFLQDPTVNDILVNTYNQIYVEKKGKLELTDARFKDDSHLMKIIDKIVYSIGRHIDESSPMVDARLPDGSRVNAIIPPLAIDGPILSIRRFATDPLELHDLIEYKSLTPEIGELLKGIVQARLNIIISGGTGSGKTTLLNVLSRFIPEDERIVTIEDSAELQIKQEHVVRLETRPPNIEGKGEIVQRDLIINSLRMRPDRIILGECRGKEAFDMLQAMNTGHDGSLTTVHANSPRDALMRLETMVAMAGVDIPSEFLRRYIGSAVDIIIQAARLADGTRKMISFQEIAGIEGNIIALQEIFSFEQTQVDPQGKVRGRFKFHGVRPRFFDKFQVAGIEVSNVIFDPTNYVEV